MFYKIIRSKIFTVIAVLMLAWIAISLLRVFNQKEVMESKIEDLEVKVGEIQKSNDYMQKVLAFIKMPEFLEREARIRLNYMAADEKMVYVYDENKKLKSPTEVDTEKVDRDNLITKFWKWIRRK